MVYNNTRRSGSLLIVLAALLAADTGTAQIAPEPPDPDRLEHPEVAERQPEAAWQLAGGTAGLVCGTSGAYQCTYRWSNGYSGKQLNGFHVSSVSCSYSSSSGTNCSGTLTTILPGGNGFSNPMQLTGCGTSPISGQTVCRLAVSGISCTFVTNGSSVGFRIFSCSNGLALDCLSRVNWNY